MNKFLIVIIIFIFIIIFKYLEPLIRRYKIKNNNEHGSARFSSEKEIKKNFKKEDLSKINEVGFPIYFDKMLNNVWFDYETPHWVYLGSTGSGKSVTQVIPYCSFLASSNKKRSAFITDPKGEIFNATSKMFQDKGYKIITIDFRHPELSNKFNILDPIIKEYENYIKYEKKANETEIESEKINYNNISMSSYAEANRLISSLSDMIMKEKVEPKDPFWNNSARQLLEGLIGFYLEELKLGNIKKEQITMTSIRKFQNSSMTNINFEKFKKYLNKKEYGSKSKDSLTSIITSNENTYKSITSVFGNKMNIFDDINVANVISESDFDMSLIGKEPTAIYVIVPDEDKTYYILVTIIVGLLYRELTKVANNQNDKTLPVRIDWLLDEFANCPPLADVESIVSVARSRGMRFHFFIQSFAQLNNVYGKDVAQIILDNCGLVYLKTNTQETAELISKRLGKRTIRTNSVSESINLNDSKSTSLISRDLLTPDEIKQLHYKMIIFPTIGYPIFRDTILYKNFRCYKSGVIERKKHSLKDLSYTYYTVEKIKLNNDQGVVEPKELLDEKQEYDKKRFENVLAELLNIIGNNKYKVLYEAVDYKTHMKVCTQRKFNKMDKLNIVKKFEKEFHFEFFEVEKGQVIIVHFIKPF